MPQRLYTSPSVPEDSLVDCTNYKKTALPSLACVDTIGKCGFRSFTEHLYVSAFVTGKLLRGVRR